jgi:CubicO group peptidase (beta-lactamase class C family)
VSARGNSPSLQVAVVQGQDVWSQTYGEATSVEHVYMNASVQKVFTTTAVLQLVERGLVELDADVSEYLPFVVGNPLAPDAPITVRLLLAHRSGLDDFPYQFEWDTEDTFAPQYRPPAPAHVQAMSHEAYLTASLIPAGANYDPQSWIHAPDREYHYSVSAYPLLRYLIGQVSGQGYEAYMHENIFSPLGMTSSGFSSVAFSDRYAIPHTRIDGENIELPIWDGRGSMMHTTAGDMATLLAAFMNDGRYGDFEVLQPETLALMQQKTTRFNDLSFFKGRGDLQSTGHGLGLFLFRGGWVGHGGSAPGFQGLFRFNPSRQVGYVILSNVNAILGGGENYASARSEIYAVQDALLSILDPWFAVHRMTVLEVGSLGAVMLVNFIVWRFRVWRRQGKP